MFCNLFRRVAAGEGEVRERSEKVLGEGLDGFG